MHGAAEALRPRGGSALRRLQELTVYLDPSGRENLRFLALLYAFRAATRPSLSALGGSMALLEVFPHTARRIAHVTPHAWASDAFSKLLEHGAGLAVVLPQAGVLLAFVAATLTVATWRLQRVLTR